MILKSLHPKNWGPFSNDTVISFEDDVTVLTGANDTGKSCILDLLSAILRWPNGSEMSKIVQEKHWNLHRDKKVEDKTWRNDPEFFCTGFFVPTESMRTKLEIQDDQQIRIDFNLAEENLGKAKIFIVNKDQTITSEIVAFDPTFIPHPIGLPIYDNGWTGTSSTHFNGGHHNDELIKNAIFTNQKKLSQFQNLDQTEVRVQTIRLIENFCSKLKRFFPNSNQYQLHSTLEKEKINWTITDHNSRETSILKRGSGIRSIINMFPSLITALSMNKQVLLWIDEPETSLHYDMQHKLRAFLEEIAREPLIQVVYATHSPAMINNGRPQSLRIVIHKKKESLVYSTVQNEFDIDNFQGIRVELGIKASDSLLFSTVNIIVEGKTESNYLPLLFAKLESDQEPGFHDWSILCPDCSFLDSKGDNWPRYARWVHQQNAIVFCVLDGDKKIPTDIKTQFDSKGISILKIPSNQDVEWLFADEVYFKGVELYLNNFGLNSNGLSPQDLQNEFNIWCSHQTTKGFDTWPFGRRVCEWVKQNFSGELEKATVFRLALHASQSNHRIRPEGIEFLKEVLSTIRNLFQSTVTP